MIIAKVRKSGKFDSKRTAEKIATGYCNKKHKSCIVRETPCYYFVEIVKSG